MQVKTRVKWLMILRTCFLIVMAGSGLILHVFYQEPFSNELINLLVAGLGFTLFSSFGLWNKDARVLNDWGSVQIVWDVIYTTFLVQSTGGLHSVFVLLYALNILSGASIFMSKGAILTAAGSALCFVLASVFQDQNAIFLNPNALSRLLASSSFLLLFGVFVAWLFRHRTELLKSLEKTTADYNELRELHSAIIDHISTGILYADQKGKIEFINRAGVKMLGSAWIGNNLKGSALESFLRANDRYESKLEIDGKLKNIGHHIARLPEGGLVVVFQDVTEIRLLERQVRLQEKLAAVGGLAAGIAHEIRNPLASISGSIQLMSSELSLDPQTAKLMKIIFRETDRLDSLAKDFLDYARPSRLQVQKISVLALFEDILLLVKNIPRFVEQKMKIELVVEPGLSCSCDPAQLKQILWNLVKNAIDASSERGVILIGAEKINRGVEDLVLFSVKDTGSGIPSELRQKIFDPFFTTKSLGTGLGLALAFEIVKAHGGSIGVESEPGNGSRFWFEFPHEGPSQQMVNSVGEQAA